MKTSEEKLIAELTGLGVKIRLDSSIILRNFNHLSVYISESFDLCVVQDHVRYRNKTAPILGNHKNMARVACHFVNRLRASSFGKTV